MRWLLFFKKCYLYLQYQFITDKSRRLLSLKQPQRKLCEDLLRQLSPEQFRWYQPADALGVLVKVRYLNIDAYTQALKGTTRLLREGKVVPPDWISTDEYTVSIDRFLTSDDGYYLNVEAAIEQFRSAGLRLCSEMVSSDTETVGLPEHNLRMLTKLFINLRELTTCLIELSLA